MVQGPQLLLMILLRSLQQAMEVEVGVEEDKVAEAEEGYHPLG